MKTKQLLLIGLVFMFASLAGFAEKVSKETARQVALNVYMERSSLVLSGNTVPFNGDPEQVMENGLTLYYIFYPANDHGFIAVAADDRIPPVLAWSLPSGQVNRKDPPPAYTWFMDQLEQQILAVLQQDIPASASVTEAWTRYTDPLFSPAEGISGVNPLVQTTWDQGCYYNADCPYDASATSYCQHALTGCGATAMAQIIKFWGAPLHGTGSHSYSHPTYGTQYANFAAATYTYTSMPLSLSDHNAEVAQLMYHCGVAQDMDYGPAGSSSYTNAIDAGFRDYFDYHASIEWRWQQNYSSSQWVNMLANELDAGRPMLYYGNDNGQNGHFFICDGYQGTDYFHFNWGWSGSYDGYFYTSSLTPGGSNFTSSQGAIFNIYPNQLPPPPSGFTMDFENTTDFSLTFNPWATADVDGSGTYTIQNHTFPNQGQAMAYICFNPANVSPPMTEAAIQPHGGSRFGACFSATNPPNNDWFISPRAQMGTGGELSFWVKSYTGDYGLERYKVGVSTTDNNPGSFTIISGSGYLEASTTWTKQTFSLSAYNGQQIYVGIQCVSHDAFIFMIDDLEIKTGSSGSLIADFAASQTTINAGDRVNFVDLSSGTPTSWNWNFPGGTPSSSTSENPTNILYNTPGTYDATLTVSDGITTSTETKYNYIEVSQSGPPSYMTLDFEGLADFTTSFSPWTTADVNGGNTYDIQDVDFPGSGNPMAYICFNPSQTTPPITNMTAHSGSRLGASFASIPPNNPNNKWLISPQMHFGGHPSMSLWVQSYSDAYGLEKFNIGVSTTGVNPADFTIVNNYPEEAPTTWTKKTYDLGAFANQDVYVGIQCVSDDAFIFMVDDIEISGNVGVNDEEAFGKVTVFPNPASGKFFVKASPPLPENTRIQVVNMLGETVYTTSLPASETTVAFSAGTMQPGVYYLVIIHEQQSVVRKITIIHP